MQSTPSTKNNRNIIAYISPSMVHNLDVKKPSVIAWWSAAYPGFGHLILGDHFFGFILLVHEEVINALSNLNMAIYLSFTGQFEQAMQSIDTKWMLAYVPPYIFSIWHTYQQTKQLNEDYIIARQRGSKIKAKRISLGSFDRLEEKKPYVSVLWSLLAPGLGHIYINRVLVALLVVPFLILVLFLSELLPAVHYTMIGDFTLARETADPQWLMNLPSIYGFMAYDAYLKTMEYNKLYKLHWQRDLEESYQSPQFQMPI